MATFFDSHFHIIDPSFPLVANQGYLPEPYLPNQYCQDMSAYTSRGGVIVSGSFQAMDTGYLLAAINQLGNRYKGVINMDHNLDDEQLHVLAKNGVCGIRFNLKRLGHFSPGEIEFQARRVHDLLGWHSEFYIDADGLAEHASLLRLLPAVTVDHLGLELKSLRSLLRLVETGLKVKACGFGRLDCKPQPLLQQLYNANPDCLMFATDLPGTRVKQPFDSHHISMIEEVLSDEALAKVMYKNAEEFYLKRKVE